VSFELWRRGGCKLLDGGGGRWGNEDQICIERMMKKNGVETSQDICGSAETDIAKIKATPETIRAGGNY